MKTNPEEMNIGEASPVLSESSVEMNGEQNGAQDKFNTIVAETENSVKKKKSFWASKISRLFGGGDVGYPGEVETSKVSGGPSFLSKVKNVLNKGVDSAVQWSNDVVNEKKTIDVTKAANFFKETVPKKLDQFADWSYKFATTGEDYPEFWKNRKKHHGRWFLMT